VFTFATPSLHPLIGSNAGRLLLQNLLNNQGETKIPAPSLYNPPTIAETEKKSAKNPLFQYVGDALEKMERGNRKEVLNELIEELSIKRDEL